MVSAAPKRTRLSPEARRDQLLDTAKAMIRAAGLQAFTRTAAIELGPYNINVNAVAPGFGDTEMTRQTALRRGIDSEEYKLTRAKNLPPRAVRPPADIATLVVFLSSVVAYLVSGQIACGMGWP